MALGVRLRPQWPSPSFERAIPKNRRDSFRETVSQFLWCPPDNVRVLARVKPTVMSHLTQL